MFSGKKIVALGGVNTNQEPVDSVEIYDIEQKKWMGAVDGIETLKDRLLGLSGVVRGKQKQLSCWYCWHQICVTIILFCSNI